MFDRIEVNLLPAEYRVHTRRIYLQREILYPLIVAGIVFLGMGFWTIMLNNDIKNYTKKLSDVNTQIEKNRHILDEINSLKKQQEEIQKKIHSLQLINVNREKWIRMQEMFCQRLPELSWLERIEEKTDSTMYVLISGKTFTFVEVAQFMARLVHSSLVKNVDLSAIEQVQGEKKLFKFDLKCAFNKEINFAVIDTIKKQSVLPTH